MAANTIPVKQKILNDPVYGFINIPGGLIFDLIQHRYFQRLRYIHQLGLTFMVYPGATNTRFHHALGALHLMGQAIHVLRDKGIQISPEEAEAVQIGILLHDIGHGPFSHTLEHVLIPEVSHEWLSLQLMESLNEEMEGRLSLAIAIFKNQYPKKFLHQLISGQLDMDRLDYLMRDSFFTGVHEGVVGYDRIIKMLHVVDDELVVEEKGLYSIEKFLVARRLMYWQVYLHKTVLAAEHLLIRILQKAKTMAKSGHALFTTPVFGLFLLENPGKSAFLQDRKWLEHFTRLDDNDVFASIKAWMDHPNPVLSTLCRQLMERRLPKVELSRHPFDEKRILDLKNKAIVSFDLEHPEDADYFVFTGSTSNSAYNPRHSQIKILFKDGRLSHIIEASDQLNISVLSAPVVKSFLCYPKEWGEGKVEDQNLISTL